MIKQKPIGKQAYSAVRKQIQAQKTKLYKFVENPTQFFTKNNKKIIKRIKARNKGNMTALKIKNNNKDLLKLKRSLNSRNLSAYTKTLIGEKFGKLTVSNKFKGITSKYFEIAKGRKASVKGIAKDIASKIKEFENFGLEEVEAVLSNYYSIVDEVANMDDEDMRYDMVQTRGLAFVLKGKSREAREFWAAVKRPKIK